MIPMSELFDELPEPQETIEQRFNVFVKQNPRLTQELIYLALYYKRHRVKAGIKKLFEDVRTNPAVMIKDGKPFKLNNDYSSFYARYLMDTVPELRGYFELRHQSPKTRKVLA